jgi:hypothetical protein
VQYSVPLELPLSADCLDLIARIFVASPPHRITLQQIRQHPWYTKNLPWECQVGCPQQGAVLASLWLQPRSVAAPLPPHCFRLSSRLLLAAVPMPLPCSCLSALQNDGVLLQCAPPS